MNSEDPPDEADLLLHLSTLFPPVRPRGWFEVRYLDNQPFRWWPVPMAVLTALVEDPAASVAALEACRGLDDWTAAARDGLAAPGLHAAALACFDAALPALVRLGEHPDLIDLVADFRDTYVSPGRARPTTLWRFRDARFPAPRPTRSPPTTSSSTSPTSSSAAATAASG